MSWDRVHAEAEVLEHVLSEELEELIAARLGDPAVDPHGDPIPTAEFEIDERPTRSLDELPVGAAGRFVRVSDSDPEMLRYLAEHGIALGARLEVVDRQPFGGPVFVRFGEREHPIGGELARAMRIETEEDDAVTPPPGPPVPALEGAGAGQTLPLYEELEESALERLLSRGKLRATLFMLGPAFVASIAYVDPGNFATNVQGGAQFGYLLLWVVLAANLVAMVIQYLSAKLGIVTDHNYPEVVREHFHRAFTCGHVGAGRDHGDVDRHRGVPRRRDRPEPAVRRAAVPRRADDRRDRVRDPRAAGARLPQVRARDQRAARDHLRRLPLRDAEDRALRARLAARADPRPPAAPPTCTSRSGSSARP